MAFMQKLWTFTELPNISPIQGVHPLVGKILSSRGVTQDKDLASFFDPAWEQIHDPWKFSQMRLAVDRIFLAFEREERITVHGDYDADGVTGSAVLITTLRELCRLLGKSSSFIDWYIPHRDAEGYGLRNATVDLLQERGTSLIVTVDCGIACVEEIAYAKTKQIDTIVVDHHQFGEVLPDGILIHPRIPGETYPFPHLAAVGVSFKLACALCDEARRRGLALPDGWEKWLMDLVAIATVTDMVPMIGENRVLEVYGLKVLNKTRRPGLLKLMELAGVQPGKVTSETIGFTIGPRINAAGRMDHASLALRLVLAESLEEASTIGAELEQCNKRRQKAVAVMQAEAEKQLETLPESSVIIFYSETWSPSLVGLVAGRYVDRFGKPCIAVGRFGDRWVGSGRSFAEYDITEAMRVSGEGILTHVGGHVQACGFSFTDTDRREELFSRLRAHALEQLVSRQLTPRLFVDANLQLSDVTWSFVEDVLRMEPFGEGNKRPVFSLKNVLVTVSELIGSTATTLRLMVRDDAGTMTRLIGFRMAERAELAVVGARIDVAVDVGINEWNGRRDIQLKLVDIRLAES